MSIPPEKPGLKTRVSRFVQRARGEPVEWDLSVYEQALSRIDGRADELLLPEVSDDQIKEMTVHLGQRVLQEGVFDQAVVDGFALVREASARVLGMRHFDVQIAAGLALHAGRVVQMQTGEGKTLVAVLPALVESLTGRGVHVLTFNNYLARRDAEWMGDVYRFLGTSVAHVDEGMSPAQRREAYLADVTYLTAREMGYDMLRESLARRGSQRVMRPLNMAIVDEADSIMIDEARVPLVLAGSDDDSPERDRAKMADLVRGLEQGVHYKGDEGGRNVFLTEAGQRVVQDQLGCSNLYESANRDLSTRLNQALHARELLRRDVDYIVSDGRIEIVDEFTGRTVPDRHWPDGLHRAVEAKEGLAIEKQGTILNSISMQHLLDLYPRLCGMTGTVFPSEEEFQEFYELHTVPIPPNVECARVDQPDRLFASRTSKDAAIVEEVARTHRDGRPILVGTASVEESERLADSLREKGIDCSVLNASNDEKEAEIVAGAGSPGAVTVSTNMAGRGTDIKLGGADEERRQEVVDLGGLYVLGTNRFESRRVDDQLRGRAGRQGDPGESRFFVSLEDELMVRFDVARWISGKRRRALGSGPVEDRAVHDKIALTQRIIEGQNLAIRRTLWNYTSLVERQRRAVLARREEVLDGGAVEVVRGLGPQKLSALDKEVPSDVLEKALRHMVLFHVDRAWSDHLATMADIREGIHLTRLGGRSPTAEYNRLSTDSYQVMEREVERGIRSSFEAAHITADGMDLDREGLRGPTSTWTYLINDNPFEWLVGISDHGNIGIGVAAGVWGGLFVIRALVQQIVKRFVPGDDEDRL